MVAAAWGYIPSTSILLCTCICCKTFIQPYLHTLCRILSHMVRFIEESPIESYDPIDRPIYRGIFSIRYLWLDALLSVCPFYR